MKKIFVLLFAFLFTFRSYGALYYSAAVDEKLIALTFDDGPHFRYTEMILDILKEYEVKATFFVIGQNAERFPEIVLRCNSEGHEIGNHTYGHKIGDKGLEADIQRTDKIIEGITGRRAKLFRPPAGYVNESVKRAAENTDKSVILWNIDTLDWRHRSPDEIADGVLSSAKSGSIILMHDFITPDTPTPDALLRIIPELKEKGFRFVTVSELIEGED